MTYFTSRTIKSIFKIELPSTLEITVKIPDTPTHRLRILVPGPQKIDKATR